MPRASLDTPLGPLTLASDGGALTACTFDPARLGAPVDGAATEAEGVDGVLAEAMRQLEAYFGGGRVGFTVPVSLRGTPFQQRVWAALHAVPHGETVSYGALAARLGRPGGAQAVGAANGQNPVAIVVPCHRVVGADGALVGYAGGLERKRALLALESGQRCLF